MFGLTSIPWRLIGVLVALAAVAGCLFGVYQRGVSTGRAEEIAHYTPLIEAAQQAEAAANARASEQSAAAAQITRTLEDQHAKDTQALAARAAAAQLAVVRVLRQYTEHPAAGSQPMRAVPAAADARPAAGEGHDEAATPGPQSRLAVDATECEHDADELGIWEAWYTSEKALTVAGH